jgi:hypothetical protein
MQHNFTLEQESELSLECNNGQQVNSHYCGWLKIIQQNFTLKKESEPSLKGNNGQQQVNNH